MVRVDRPHPSRSTDTEDERMVTIECPWCQGNGPVDIELLHAAGGHFTCAACLTTVELVEDREAELALAA